MTADRGSSSEDRSTDSERGWPWYRRVFWMGWGVDVRLRASWLTLTWRPRFAFFWSPDGTPSDAKARLLLGDREARREFRALRGTREH